MRKTITFITAIILFSLLPVSFIFAQQSNSQLATQNLQQQIQELQKQIIDLQVQLEIVKKAEIPASGNIRFTKILQRGIKDDEVKILQEFLKQSPDIYPEGLVTGYFGPLTEAAVKRFQKKYGIETIGIVGPKTRAKINELILTKPISTEKIEKPAPSQTLTPPASWPDWLKKEREQNIKDVHQMEDWALSVGWKSLQNDNLPQLLEWAKKHEFKFIGTGETIKDEVSITAMPGVDIIFKELNNFPPHLIKLLKGTTVYLSTEYGGSTTWTSTESESKIGISIKKAFIHQTKPPDEMTHELAHALDMVSIRVDKSSEFTIGKTDEEVRLLREEFERVFQISKEPWTDSTKAPPGFVNIYASTNSSENFASHFDYYINQPEYFRERAAKESGLAQKYNFLKTKIFLGKEY